MKKLTLRAQGLDQYKSLFCHGLCSLNHPATSHLYSSGIFGGALVCYFVLDISPTMFLALLSGSNHYQLLCKDGQSTYFAFLIAVIGCLQGFKVSGSLNLWVTHHLAVVHSILL